MCDPIAVTAATAAIGAAEQIAAGEAKAAEKRGEAARYERDATQAEQDAAIAERRQRETFGRSFAQRRARLGRAGVTVAGSPLDTFDDLLEGEEVDAATLRRSGQIRAQENRYKAARMHAAADEAETTGFANAGKSLLSRGAAAGSQLSGLGGNSASGGGVHRSGR